MLFKRSDQVLRALGATPVEIEHGETEKSQKCSSKASYVKSNQAEYSECFYKRNNATR